MQTRRRELDQIQRWMQSVITHPGGVTAGVASDEARTYIDLAPESLDQVICQSQKQTSQERLGIYANAYYARLLECLRDDFPALTFALGEETFNAFAFGYLQEFPSASYTLGDLSRRFPQYLNETRPTEDSQNSSPGWPDFLIDLATLEQTFNEIFDGPGIENRRLLQPEDLAEISPESWPGARLIPAPCLRLLQLSFPVHEYVAAVHRREEPLLPEPQPTCLVIMRRNYLIHREAVSQPQYLLLKALAAGKTVSEAIADIAAHPEVDPEQLAPTLQRWFHDWAKLAIFTRVETTPQ